MTGPQWHRGGGSFTKGKLRYCHQKEGGMAARRFKQELFPNTGKQFGTGAGSLSARPCLLVQLSPLL